ncbi:unnamed protein product [Meganyctiphanes norvegica]|uniref:Uncharacterized protein n=1 Tax=Meganyctiphanes norvegica TaxID=48144 RepID=A0AAV2QFP0_MEGNR
MSTNSYNGNSMAITGSSRRDGEPKSKKRRLLEATESGMEKDINEYISTRNMQNDFRFKGGYSETVSKTNNHLSTILQQSIDNNNRISSDIIEITEHEDERDTDKPQEDLLSKLCSEVGIDSDLTVEETPYPTNAGMVQIRPPGINPSYYQMQRPNQNMVSRMSVPYDPRYNQVRHMYVSHTDSQSRYPYPEPQARYPYSYHQHRPQYVRQNSHPMYPNNNNHYYQQHPHYRPRYHYMTSVGPISPTEIRPTNFIRSGPPPSYQENIQQRLRPNAQNITENMHRPHHPYQTRQAVRMSNQQEALSTNLINPDLGKSDNQTILQSTSDNSLSTPKSFESCTFSQQGLPKGHMDLVSSGSSLPERHNGISVVSGHMPQRLQEGPHMHKAITNHPVDQRQMHDMHYNDRKLYPPYHAYHQNIPYHNYNQGLQASQFRLETQSRYPNQIIADKDEKSSQNFMKTVPNNPSSVNSYSSPYMNPYNVTNMERHSNLPVSPKDLPQSQVSTCRQISPHVFKPQQRLMPPGIIQTSPAYAPKYGTLSPQELSHSMSSSNIQTSPHRLMSPQGQISPHGAKVSQLPVPSSGLHSNGGLTTSNRTTPPHKLPQQCRMEVPQRLSSPQHIIHQHRLQSLQQLATHTTGVSSNQGNLATNPSLLPQKLPHTKEVPKNNSDGSCLQSHQKDKSNSTQNSPSTNINERKQKEIDPTITSAEPPHNTSKTQNNELEALKKDIKSENETEFKKSENTCEQNSKSIPKIFQKDIKLESTINCSADSNVVDISTDNQVERKMSSIDFTESTKYENVDEGAHQRTENIEFSKEGVDDIQISTISSECMSRPLNYQSYNDCSVKSTKIVGSHRDEIDKPINEINTKLNGKRLIEKEFATKNNEAKSFNETNNHKGEILDDSISQKTEKNILPCRNYNNHEMDGTSNNDSKEEKSKTTECIESICTIDASMPLIEECPIVTQRKNNNYFTSFQEVFTASVKTNLVKTETLLIKPSEKLLPVSLTQSSNEIDFIKGGVSSQSLEKSQNISGFQINSISEKNEIMPLVKDIDKIKNKSYDINYKSDEILSVEENRPSSAPGSSFQTQLVQHIPQNRPASEPLRELSAKLDCEVKTQLKSFSSEKKDSSISDLTTSDIFKIVDEMETNSQIDDDIFVSRLSLVLEDLVSVPEASDLKHLLSSPGKLLSAMVQKGGYEPSNHTCAKQRLRRDFLSVIRLCLDPVQLSAWGWDQSSPDYILQQLVKVQLQGGFEKRLICQDDNVNSVLKIPAIATADDNISSTKNLSISCSKRDPLPCGSGENLDMENSSDKNLSSSFKLNTPSEPTVNKQKSLNEDSFPVNSSVASTENTNFDIGLPKTFNDNENNMEIINETDQSTNTITNSANTTTIKSITNELCSKAATSFSGITNTATNNIMASNITQPLMPTSTTECTSKVPIIPATVSASTITASLSTTTVSTTNNRSPVISDAVKVTTKSVIVSTKNNIISSNTINATSIKGSTSHSSSSSNVVATNTKPILSNIPLINATNTFLSSQTDDKNDVHTTRHIDSPCTIKSPSSATSLCQQSEAANAQTTCTAPLLHKLITSTNSDVISTQTPATTTSALAKMVAVPIPSSSLKDISSSSATKSNEASVITQIKGSLSSNTAVTVTNDTTLNDKSTSTHICSLSNNPTVDSISSSNNLMANIKSNEASTIHCNVTTSTVSIDNNTSSDHNMKNSILSNNDTSNQSTENDVKNNISIINSESTSDNINKSTSVLLNSLPAGDAKSGILVKDS